MPPKNQNPGSSDVLTLQQLQDSILNLTNLLTEFKSTQDERQTV